MSKTKTQPALFTTAQQLGSIIKSARDIMRKDKGLNGDLDRLPMLTWIMFLKFLDDMEQRREFESQFGERFRPILEVPYRWRDWAANEGGISGEELKHFINDEEVMRPDGTRGAGLFAYLRRLQSVQGADQRSVVAAVFRGVSNRMESGYLLRDVINKINGIHFNTTEEVQTLGRLYESLLKEMRDAAGDSGEFYTPRTVVRFMVEVIDPQLGEIVLDPACGTGGFLTEALTHLQKQVRTTGDNFTLQSNSIRGGEAKSLPYLLAQMNLLLHGLETPRIQFGNSLEVRLAEITDKDRVDVILTNPPFGGEEERKIQDNYPTDKRTSETALLFLQLIMRKLRRPPDDGRAAVVVPNGTLFGEGVGARIKEELLTAFNLHTIVRLPNGVFAPYTGIPTNILFFDRSGPTGDVWYYEMSLPEGRKSYSKTQPLQYEEFGPCLAWWKTREENERAWKWDFAAAYREARAKAAPHWEAAEAAEDEARELSRQGREVAERIATLERVPSGLMGSPAEDAQRQGKIAALKKQGAELQAREARKRDEAKEQRALGDAIYWPIYNLDRKNPSAAQDFEHLPPEQLVADILDKERRIAAILGEIQAMLAVGSEHGEV